MNARFLLVVLLPMLLACQANPPRPPEPDSAERRTINQPLPGNDAGAIPADRGDIRTTDGRIYMNNLDGRIRSLEAAQKSRPRPEMAVLLAASLAHRGHVTGNAGDLERALTLVDRTLDDEPDQVPALKLRARLRASLHRFEAALADLDRARRAGTEAAALASARADVLVALGRVDEAARVMGPHHGENLASLAFRANRLIDEGRLRDADRLFTKAQAAYQDSNPYPLAWLHVQHGVLYLRAGDVARARTFFRAAHERLPAYYLATEHLAEVEGQLGNHERSIALYRRVVDQTGDPVFLAALAGQLRAAGDDDAAARTLERAANGFEHRMQRYPEATWQHAAEFHLSQGETAKAVELARRNSSVRGNVGSLLLLARSESAAGNRGRACDAWNMAGRTGLQPPGMQQLEAIFSDC